MSSTSIDSLAFDRGTDPLLRILSIEQARALLDFKGDETVRTRIDELAAKSNEGLLTESEKAEYEGYARANRFIAILQAKARRRLATP